MLLNFREWYGEHSDRKRLRKTFLRRLGYSTNAMDDTSVSTMRVSSLRKKIFKALNSIGLEEDKIEDLKNWVKTYPESSLQDLLNQIDPADVIHKKEIGKEPIQGDKAILPKGKSAMPQQRSPQDQEMIGYPPKQASMQVPY